MSHTLTSVEYRSALPLAVMEGPDEGAGTELLGFAVDVHLEPVNDPFIYDRDVERADS